MKTKTTLILSLAAAFLALPVASEAQSPQRATIKVWEKAQKIAGARSYTLTPSMEGTRDAEAKEVVFTIDVKKGLDYLFLISIDGAYGMNIFVEDELQETIVQNLQKDYYLDEDDGSKLDNTPVRGVGWRSKYNGTISIYVKPVGRSTRDGDNFSTLNGRYAFSALMGRRGTFIMNQFGSTNDGGGNKGGAPTQN